MGQTPLHIASNVGNIETLLELGADIDAKDSVRPAGGAASRFRRDCRSGHCARYGSQGMFCDLHANTTAIDV